MLMILFSSSSIALSLAFDHLLNVHYALVFGPLAFVSSLFGVIVLGRIVRATGERFARVLCHEWSCLLRSAEQP